MKNSLAWISGLVVVAAALGVSAQDLSFQKIVLCNDAYYCDGVAVGDINRDGIVDVVAGPWWYQGPEFKQRHEIYQPVAFDPAKGQSDSLFSDVYDFNGDGWQDVLVRGRVHLHPARWYENPHGRAVHWQRHEVFPKIQGENPPFTDVTGDGRPEIVTHWKGYWGYVGADWQHPQKPWTFHRLGAPGDWPQFHHGQGTGDIDGDGLTDIVINQGWLSRKTKVNAGGASLWSYHEIQFAKRGGAQMLVYDVDGDADNDIVTSLDAHGWGLAWFENQPAAQAGDRTFRQHMIMDSRDEQAKYGVAFSQPHALVAGDIDNDGLTDVVVGKRRWAHGPKGDIEPNAPAVVYWFQLERTKSGVQFRPHLIDDNSGVGLQIAAADVNRDGRLDVLTASKLGTFVFLQRAGPQ